MVHRHLVKSCHQCCKCEETPLILKSLASTQNIFAYVSYTIVDRMFFLSAQRTRLPPSEPFQLPSYSSATRLPTQNFTPSSNTNAPLPSSPPPSYTSNRIQGDTTPVSDIQRVTTSATRPPGHASITMRHNSLATTSGAVTPLPPSRTRCTLIFGVNYTAICIVAWLAFRHNLSLFLVSILLLIPVSV